MPNKELLEQIGREYGAFGSLSGETICQIDAEIRKSPEHEAGLELARQLVHLERLVTDLQRHAREHGWQDVDEPIAALLAWKSGDTIGRQ